MVNLDGTWADSSKVSDAVLSIGAIITADNMPTFDLGIDSKANQSDVRAAIRKAFAAIDPRAKGKTLRLIGAALTGEELALRLGENRVDYGVHDYDDYVLELPDDRWSNFANCKAIKRAIDIVKSYKATFGEPSRSLEWLAATGNTPQA